MGKMGGEQSSWFCSGVFLGLSRMSEVLCFLFDGLDDGLGMTAKANALGVE